MVFLTILALVAMLPLLVIVGIAAGPAALVILFLLGCTLLVMVFERARERHAEHVQRRRAAPPRS